MNFPITRRSLSKFNYFIRDISIRKRYFSDEIIIKKIGPVTCIGLNRPEKKNCINSGIIKDLEEAVGNFERDDSSPVAVLYGERGNFSYGYDMNEFNENPDLIEEIKHIGLLESCCRKVVVAALSGYALGPGFDLALWCDFRIVEDTAALAGYARQFGMPLTDSSAERLVTMLGLNKALDLVLTGRIVQPKEALESGIATRLVACGTGLGQAVSFANSIANMPSSCLQADRIGLLAASKKYSESVRKSLLQSKMMFAEQAIQECKNKLHLTMTGDVRQKKW